MINSKISTLSSTIEQVHSITKYHQIYLTYKKEPSDKAFYEEYKSQIILYQNTIADLKKSYSKLPNSKAILQELDLLHEKKNTLMQEYSSSKSDIKELYQIRKNYKKYMARRWRGNHLLYIHTTHISLIIIYFYQIRILIVD